MKNGARVPGTALELDPVQAAFNFGTMIRWLDFNDAWLAAEWGHPSDNLGGILMTADYVSRMTHEEVKIKDIFVSMIKAHEIQGVIALENAFNRVGLDHVLLVKVATTALAMQLLGGDEEKLIMPYHWLGSMARVCELIDMPPIRVRGNHGRQVMPLAGGSFGTARYAR